jgi:GT2 family glycosyltransferase/SAM-dependent methyltransferase
MSSGPVGRSDVTTGAATLSVVIPTSGRWEVLARTLEGLARQSVSGFGTVVVVNGLSLTVPEELRARFGQVQWFVKDDQGPGPARNLGVRACDGELLLFLGDDTIPEPDLVERHLRRHELEPMFEVAVLGRVRWHPEVAGGRVNRWLDWSGTQFDYDQLEREAAAAESGAGASEGGGYDAGFGRLYTSNVSLKRALFERTGGFDPEFRFGYEDIDFGWRAAEHGMVLRYEPAAVVNHLHHNTMADLRHRFDHVGAGERLMAAKHEWFTPWYHERFTRHAGAAPVWPVWARLIDHVPPNIERLWWPVHVRADRWYHQQLADDFMAGWNRQLDLEELRAYLGEEFELERLWRHTEGVEREASAAASEAAFYRTSRAYLYDLTAFAMTGIKEPYHRELRRLVPAGARLLDYGCGIGADGLRLLERGYAVEFADFDNPSVEYLRWRLVRRGLQAPVYDLDADAGAPGALPARAAEAGVNARSGAGFDAAYSFDVIEHVEDPFAFLTELESRARLVVVNLLEPVPGDLSIHHELPIKEIVRHAKGRGLKLAKRFHGRSLLIAYRGDLPE